MAGRVRQSIDVKALEAYLTQHVPEVEVPITVKQFGYGQSNPTYQLTTPSGVHYVLRKKPPGKLLSKTAHKVEREHRIIDALGRKSDMPVPRALCLCEDPAVLGTAFYVMSFLDGRIFADPSLPGVGAAERAAMWADAVRTLARLHRVDAKTAGLDGFGRTRGFYERQVRTWTGISAAQAGARDVETGVAVGRLPHFEDLVRFFADEATQPRDRGTLIHGDYKIDNLVFHKTEPRVIGVLDWEMSTIGHPLSDLANLMAPFATSRLLKERLTQQSSSSPGGLPLTANPGFLPGATAGLPTPDKILATYAAEAGWDPREGAQMGWATAFGIFRLACIAQGIAARFAARQASSEEAKRIGQGRIPLAEFAWVLVGEVRARGEGEEKEEKEEKEGKEEKESKEEKEKARL